jgi:hypothetical protein
VADPETLPARGSNPDPPKSGAVRQAGLREVLLVGAAVVLTVLAAATATSVLPADVRAIVTDTPLAIVVLLVATTLVLLRVARSTRG